MDYGSIVYSSARATVLKKLNSIHHAGLRLTTGAFRTSPIASLYCDSGIPSLGRRRDRLLLNYATNVWANPSHINYDNIFNNAFINNYALKPTLTRPATVRIRELTNKINMRYPQVLSKDISETPPWTVPKIVCLTDLTRFKKHDTCKELYKTLFHHILSEYHYPLCIFTDGSKTNNGVGAAINIAEQTHSWTIPTESTIYTAELYAIWQALRFCEFSNQETHAICSDSLSSLQSITNSFSKDPLVIRINCLLKHLDTIGKKIIFIWCPGHVGLFGNEKADKAAREAANKKDIDDNIPIRPDDLKAQITNKINELWQLEWTNGNTKMREIKETVNKWKPPKCFSRRENVILTRLRIGHTRLTSQYLLQGENQPLCETCGSAVTVKHIIEQCIKYANLFEQLRLPRNIKIVLTPHIEHNKKILELCRKADIYKLI